MNKAKLNLNISSFLSILLILSGIFISSYLFNHYLDLIKAENNTGDVCSTVFGKSCDNALKSSYSEILGLPLSAWNILYYFTIILFWSTPIFFGDEFKKINKKLIYIITLTGVLVALLLLIVMVIQPTLFCPMCTILHGINISLFIFINHDGSFSHIRICRTILNKLNNPLKKNQIGSFSGWKFVGLTSSFFIIASIYFGLYIVILNSKGDSGFIDAKTIFNEFYDQPVMIIPLDSDDPILGKQNSTIKIVVFSDFFCPACKRFSEDLDKVIKTVNGSYSVVFKHFPLSTDCNTSIGNNLHPLACEAANAGVIAAIQGKFWTFHDTVFRSSYPYKKDFIQQMAVRAGLSMSNFDSLKNSQTVIEKVSRDIALAQRLKIDATPTVFLNGRLVKDMRKGIFEILVRQELKNVSQ